jgi:hypothetical protein
MIKCLDLSHTQRVKIHLHGLDVHGTYASSALIHHLCRGMACHAPTYGGQHSHLHGLDVQL